MGLLAEVSILVLVTLLLRWSVSFNSYSGQGKPPMFGDYEAQRHWMEITVNLPAKDWYRNTSDNDLLYWGLDYPPLTAYHSQICGYIAQFINPEWVRLNTSRGYESYQHKLFMRYSVLVADILIFVPAVILYFLSQDKVNDKAMMYGLMVTLMYPGLILIDYGHFQYNGISLGLTILAVTCIGLNSQLIAAVLFTMALNYKQMELYHAMPFFVYLLGSAIHTKSFKGLFQVFKIGITVILTFMLCWAPFLTSVDSIKAVLVRLFPFNRGLFEDKVASFWCSISIVIKLKNILSQDQLVTICLISTLIGLLPSVIHLLYRPTITNFKYSLVNSSLVFFLFSFQVHEKSILIAALSVCMLAIEEPFINIWFLSISTFSMLPLLIKDGLLMPYCALSVLYLLVTYYTARQLKLNTQFTYLFLPSILGAVVLTITSQVLSPPQRYPDLFPVLISAYSCGHFLLFLVYFHYRQLTNSSNTLTKSSKSHKSAKIMDKKQK